MEPLPPTAFPRRVKRFQSLSMTPLDYQADFETDTLNNPAISSNKINFSTNNRFPIQQQLEQNQNPVTNQSIFKNRKKLFQNDNSLFKNTLKAQIKSINKQTNNPLKTSTFLSNYKHKKMTSSEIFDTNSINSRSFCGDKKNYLNSSLALKNSEKGSISQEQQRQNQDGKKLHVPSFLLNKKRMPRSSQASQYFDEIPREMYESTPLNLHQRKAERCHTFKDRMIISSIKSIESEHVEVFSPPNQKIAYSKATASTLCTNLPREESHRTFKDFDQMQELKEIENSLEESDNSHTLSREFSNLFRKEENGVGGNIEDEIAELFSDEEAESEEFNQDLHNELQELF